MMLDNVVGQPEAVALLRRVASGHLTRPLLLLGHDGVGKRFSVQCLVHEMFCTGSKQSDCNCMHCTQLAADQHPDFLIVSAPENKDIGIEQIRDVLEDCNTFPVLARHRIILVDGADRLTSAAANAFLKTLEEPPSNIRIFLSAYSQDRVIPTIRSRCGIVRYNRLPADFIASKLQRIESDPEKALVIARLADGSIGRAIRYKAGRRLVLRDKMLQLLVTATSGDLARIFIAVDDIGDDLSLGLTFLAVITRDILLLPHDPAGVVNTDVVDILENVRNSFKPGVPEVFWERLKVVLGRHDRTRINLSFQVKAFLAGTFV
jgi:DNA polymerase-3 subunit delta'